MDWQLTSTDQLESSAVVQVADIGEPKRRWRPPAEVYRPQDDYRAEIEAMGGIANWIRLCFCTDYAAEGPNVEKYGIVFKNQRIKHFAIYDKKLFQKIFHTIRNVLNSGRRQLSYIFAILLQVIRQILNSGRDLRLPLPPVMPIMLIEPQPPSAALAPPV